MGDGKEFGRRHCDMGFYMVLQQSFINFALIYRLRLFKSLLSFLHSELRYINTNHCA